VIAEAVAAVALSRGPVAESVTRRSAVISFRTTVRVHASVVLQDGERFDAGTGIGHVARLIHLTPGLRYRYRVETGSGVLAEGTFRAAPRRATRFTFAVVGDFGSGTANEAAVASLIESWHPDFVLTVGDNAYPLGSAGLLDGDIFEPYAAVMRESAWFPALGNHDVKADGGKPELEAFHSLGKERWYRFTWGNAAVVVLDSDTSVGPGSPQLRFARKALARHSCFRFAAWHHPPWEPPGRRISPGLRRTIVPLVQQDRIQVVFLGHLHAYARSRPRRGVVYVAVGTGGAPLDSDARKLTIPLARVVQGRFGALRVDVTGRTARLRYETVDGTVRDSFRLACDPAARKAVPKQSSVQERSASSSSMAARIASHGRRLIHSSMEANGRTAAVPSRATQRGVWSGTLRSSTTQRPPGERAAAPWAMTSPLSGTCVSAYVDRIASTSAGKSNPAASACTRVTFLHPLASIRFPAWASMASVRSTPTIRPAGPIASSSSAKFRPVPQAMSTTVLPRRRSSARTARRRCTRCG
jgi:calcineurin-like phosphoesterase family protein